MSYKIIKRITDFFLALVGLILLSPLFIIISLVIYWKMGSPVIFKHTRPGLKGRIFNLYKFRTMISASLEDNIEMTDEKRVTPLGHFLRSTSLDELPELFNVIKGDMSLVGPRPLLVEYLDKYTPQQMRRHDVLPGITGLAQVKGRNDLSWEEKFKYDVFYVDHIGWKIDLWILFYTFKVVMMRSGFRKSGELRKFGAQ